jgi:hypothetical protein
VSCFSLIRVMRVRGFVTGSFSVERAGAASGLIADSSQQAPRILGHDG